MACILTTGRKLPCKSAFGGIKKILFADYGTIASVTVVPETGEATFTDASTPPTWYEYDVKGASSLETSVTSSRENGTTFYTQTLNLTLTYLDALTQQELQILAVGRPYIVIVDFYGNSFLCGADSGMECTGGTIVTGAGASDMSGFTLTFEGMESEAPYFLSTPVTADAEQIAPTGV